MTDLEGSPDIILVWPDGQSVPEPVPVTGYSVRSLPRAKDSWWIDIHREAVPTFKPLDLERWLERYRDLSLPEGILVATDDATGQPAAQTETAGLAREETR